jgi:hypothetical protein
MKYNIIINQRGIIENNLIEKTDLVDWCIIDYLRDWYFAETKKTIFVQDDGCNYVWVNYNHLMQEIPIINIKKKDNISKRIKKLKQLGLIRTFQDKQNNLYFILTPKCIQVIGFSESTFLSPPEGTGAIPAKRDTYPLQKGQGLSPQKGTAQINNQSSKLPESAKQLLSSNTVTSNKDVDFKNIEEANNIFISHQFSNENCQQHSANAEVVEKSNNFSSLLEKSKKPKKQIRKKEVSEEDKKINDDIRELLKYFDDCYRYLFKIGYNCEFKVEFDLLRRDFKRYLKEKKDIEKTKKYFLDLIDIYFTEIEKQIDRDNLNPCVRDFHTKINKLVFLRQKVENNDYKFTRFDKLMEKEVKK